jgi:putative ABC transport system permease protein
MLSELWSEIRYRLRALFRRKELERELDAELLDHLERETEKHQRAGLSREAALRRARVDFGGVERIKDDSRDARGLAALDSLLQDLRYAWRGIRHKPLFSIAVVLTLALGIGANTAMFGIVDRLLFRAPAYLRDPARTNRVYLTWLQNGKPRTERNFEYPRFADLTRWSKSFARTAAFANRQLPVGTGEDTREMLIVTVSGAFFEFFDAPPALGRYFGPAEDTPPAGAPVAVLSYGFWQTRYGGRPDALGQQLVLGTVPCTIIGVAPRGFLGISDDGNSPAAFMPITTYAGSRNPAFVQSYNWGWLEMLLERKPGSSVAAASADLTAAYEKSWEAERLKNRIPPASVARPQALAGPLQFARGPLADRDSKVATWVSGVALIVLLVACANVANLLLARAVGRRREIAMRLALGVSRRRLVQQLLTESLLLAALGGLGGLALAQWGGRLLGKLFSGVGAARVWSDWRSLGFLALVTLGVALLTGLAPALHAGRGDVVSALKAGAREGSYRRSRTRTALLLLQGALSVVLLVGAGLFVQSLRHVRAFRLGYDIDPVLYAEPNLRGVRLSAAEGRALEDRLLAAAATMPGVVSASFSVSVPFWSNEGRFLIVPGVDSVLKLGHFMLQSGSPEYFATMGTRILRGRGIQAGDQAGGPRIVVVSENMAKLLWPGRDALGQQMRIGSDTAAFSTVVGIAEDMRGRSISGEPEFWYYVPHAQHDAWYAGLVARVNGRARDFSEDLRKRLQQAMPGSAYITVRPLQEFVGLNERAWEFGATMFVGFGALALVLAAVGLYSVIAYTVAQRTHELGVRAALGARSRDMLWLVVGQGVAFTAAGIAIGGAIALLAGRWIEPLLFGQSARDPAVFGLVAAVLLVVAVVASAAPARRALRADPTVALRTE